MRVINESSKIAKVWLGTQQEPHLLEAGAQEQIMHLLALPFMFQHVAIMPDCHQGYGMPIGGVLATEGVVIPNAVGVDIGCGMCAVRTSVMAEALTQEVLKAILTLIRNTIPVGFEHHKEIQSDHMPPGWFDRDHMDTSIVSRESNRACFQLGTLGGGNHFIEIQREQDGHVWIMIHSGSRNLGKQVANHYNRLAIDLNQQWHTVVPKEHELAFLPVESEEGQAYLEEMQYCVEFALANRKLMMERVIQSMCLYTAGAGDPFQAEPMINIAHNYAALEHHFGKDVWVHRKGATRARLGEVGIIPGSQGSRSYIVRGKGNPESFQSCSHEAGRQMGRKQAQRTLDLDQERARLDAMGVMHAIRSKDDLDEAPGAYKSIEEVMNNQKDLVEILVELSPLAVIKG
jgi:tRNA-splicing ligase RtcB (3'-phosphate/5'-hydroxy nucleic acid ligase)